MRSYIPPDHKGIPEQAARVFEGIIFDVYQWEQEMFDGSFETFEQLKRPDTTEVICIEGDKILISKEEQPHKGAFLTVPGGRHDHEGEHELDAAKREVKEELGYTFKNWKLIHTKQHTGKIDHIVYTFLATDVASIEAQQLDAGEKIEILKYSFEEFKNMENDPNVPFFNAELLDSVQSLEELLALPSLHDYKK